MRACPHCHLIYQNAAFERCELHGLELVELDDDPLIGAAVDRYQILELLGSGAMGRVYRARHAVLERVVAIKVLFGDYACEESFRLRFDREAQAIGQMRHENVVNMTDFGAVEGLPFIVMDYLEGTPLHHLIEREAPLDEQRVARLARQIAAGLAEAHHHGFVHRDLKPGNVLVCGEEPNEVAKLLDFGVVSMVFAPVDGASRLTTEGQVIGTPMYMSPEQTLDPNVSFRSDLYSLGVILYEMLSGRPPFTAEGRVAMMLAHVGELPAPLVSQSGLEALTMRLLEKDPNDRPASASEVVATIDRLVGEPTRELRFQDTIESPRPRMTSTELRAPAIEERRAWTPSKSQRPLIPVLLIPVLIIEGDSELTAGIQRRLDVHLFSTRHASRLDQACKMLQHETFALVIVDLTLPDSDGLDTLDRLRVYSGDLPIVVLSKLPHEWLAVEAIRRGADDYLISTRPELTRLPRAVRFALERRSHRPRQVKEPRPTSSANRPAPPISLARSMIMAGLLLMIGLMLGLAIPSFA